MRKLSEIISYLIDHLGAHVLLVGHYFTVSSSDDRRVCTELMRMHPGCPNLTQLEHAYNAAEVKAVLSCCDAVLSSRYHALIAALSQEIPAIAFGWSHKYEALLEEVGIPASTIQIGDDSEATNRTLTSIVQGSQLSDRSRSLIRQRIGLANTQFDEVAAMISGSGGSPPPDGVPKVSA